MAIPEDVGHNFQTLLEAAQAGHLVLMETQDKITKATVYAICAVNFDGKEYEMVPFAKMIDGNPYDQLNPPDPNGGFAEDTNA